MYHVSLQKNFLTSKKPKINVGFLFFAKYVANELRLTNFTVSETKVAAIAKVYKRVLYIKIGRPLIVLFFVLF